MGKIPTFYRFFFGEPPLLYLAGGGVGGLSVKTLLKGTIFFATFPHQQNKGQQNMGYEHIQLQ